MALFAMARNPSVVAAVAIMPSHVDGAYEGTVDQEWKDEGVWINMRDLPPGGGQKIKRFNLPYSFFEDQITHNVTDELALCVKPKLFIYGNRDSGSTPERVKTIYERAAGPKEIVELDSDHNYRHHPQLIDEVNRITDDFLRRYVSST